MKVKITLEEKLTYRHEVVLDIPDDFSDEKLERIINKSEKQSDGLGDFVCFMEDHFDVVEVSEQDNSSPNEWEIEVVDVE